MVSYSISSILQHPRVCIWRQQTDPEDGSPAQPPSCGLTQACSVCTGLSDLPGLSYNKKYGEKGFNNPICFRIVAILKFLTLTHKKTIINVDVNQVFFASSFDITYYYYLLLKTKLVFLLIILKKKSSLFISSFTYIHKVYFQVEFTKRLIKLLPCLE